MLETLTKEVYDYVILPEDATPTGSSSIETREDGLMCAKLFRENRERIDGIIVSLPNFGFETSALHTVLEADQHRRGLRAGRRTGGLERRGRRAPGINLKCNQFGCFLASKYLCSSCNLYNF